MNHNTFRNKVESLMMIYMDYLSTCGNISLRMQLLEEINKLSDIIIKIDNMTAASAKNEIESYWITIESKINE